MTKTKLFNLKKIHLLSFLTLFAVLFSFGSGFNANAATWQNQEIKVKGEWSIESRSDGDYLVLSDSFKTKNAPDLKFFVTNKSYDSVTGKNATDGAKLIAQISSNKGAQEYKIPADLNLSDYNSLILHCEQFSKLWASTPLK